MTFRFFCFLYLSGMLSGCQQPQLSPLEKSLWSAHPALMKVLHDPDYYEIQIRYTHIARDHEDRPLFQTYDFNLKDSSYFYPASTVKLPVAVLALEYIDSLGIDPETPYRISGDSLLHTLEDDVREIFAVSDNQAYNRLYELMGRDYINARMEQLELVPFRLAHRLATKKADTTARDSLFFKSQDSLILKGGTDRPLIPLTMAGLNKGIGYIFDERYINAPMNFSKKNYFPLSTQHELMKRLLFPEQYASNKQLALTKKSRALLLKSLSAVPRDQGYDATDYYDSYGKFFLFGDTQESIPQQFKIYNKVGYAYGTLSETAYITDLNNGIEFLLSATILVNKNGVFNDDEYEYETLGIPFMAQLGRELYLREREMLQK